MTPTRARRRNFSPALDSVGAGPHGWPQWAGAFRIVGDVLGPLKSSFGPPILAVRPCQQLSGVGTRESPMLLTYGIAPAAQEAATASETASGLLLGT